jgi:Antitoxin Phd_YefM, type II toxin-antitoxin system
MKEIDFSEFRVRCSEVFEQVRKTRRPIRVIRFGKPLAEVIPLSHMKDQPRGKKLGNKSRAPQTHLGR